MNLGELIQKLTDIGEELARNGVKATDVDILVGVQPSYPLTNVIAGIVTSEELDDYMEGGLDEQHHNAVWLAVDAVSGYRNDRSPYAPKALWDAAL